MVSIPNMFELSVCWQGLAFLCYQVNVVLSAKHRFQISLPLIKMEVWWLSYMMFYKMLNSTGDWGHPWEMPTVVWKKGPIWLLSTSSLVELLSSTSMTWSRLFFILNFCIKSQNPSCSVKNLFRVDKVLLMLKMFVYQEVTAEDLLKCAPTWSEINLSFCKQSSAISA